MKTCSICKKCFRFILVLALVFFFMPVSLIASDPDENMMLPDTLNTVQFKGKIMDKDTHAPLLFATITVEGTNIATVSNSEGNFVLRVPKDLSLKTKINISFLGYKEKAYLLSDLKSEKNKLELESLSFSLGEVDVLPKDIDQLIREVVYNKKQNYMQEPVKMTTFYRETIKRRRSYVSLAEAVVDVYMQPYNSMKQDRMKLYKARKDADYKKMDTVTFKLQGGPYSTLMLDVMKEPYSILNVEDIDYYDFTLENITKVNDKLIYIVDFKQKPYIKEPLFYGKLYIDVDSKAVTRASYSINLEDKKKAAEIFIKRKPSGADVYPTEATYLVNYRQLDGKWMYSYSRGQISFKIDWDKKLFNTVYTSTIEMALTDWSPAMDKPFKSNEKIKPDIILQDDIEGFYDPQFWGDYNVIEPESSIESVIKKIKKRLDRR